MLFALLLKRDDWDFLLKIRNGEFEFDDLMEMVEDKMEQVKIAYEKSILPDINKAESILIEMWRIFY